jgi:hypothetical protein
MMETGGDRVARGRSAIARANPRQHPLGEKPSISVMLADPPSVEGIGGGQMVERVLGAAAVVLADCVEVSGPSPGSDPTAVLPLAVVWPFTCAAIWGWAVVMPRKMIATRIVRCISRSSASRQSQATLLTRDGRQRASLRKMKMKFRKGRQRKLRVAFPKISFDDKRLRFC